MILPDEESYAILHLQRAVEMLHANYTTTLVMDQIDKAVKVLKAIPTGEGQQTGNHSASTISDQANAAQAQVAALAAAESAPNPYANTTLRPGLNKPTEDAADV